MSRHPFILEPYKGKATRHTCPQCDKPREFTRYVVTDTGEPLADHVGKCNRADACGYHYTPKQFRTDGGALPTVDQRERKPEPPPLPPFLHDRAEVVATRQHPEGNTLSAYWRDRIGADRWDKVAKDYALGTWQDGRITGAAVYWQVDIHGNVKGGKVMQYDPATGHRAKGKGTTNWVHALGGGIPDGYRLEQCLFGEHLLKAWPMDKTVAVVESEKTAMIAAALMPVFLWVATGSKDGFKLAKLQALTGRMVLAFPDLSRDGSAYWGWKERAEELKALFASIHVSDLLEAGATAETIEKGLDIADLLLIENAPTPDTSATITTAPTPSAPPPPPPPILSAAEVAVGRMAERNPAINTLVNLLGLDLSRAKITNLSPAIR